MLNKSLRIKDSCVNLFILILMSPRYTTLNRDGSNKLTMIENNPLSHYAKSYYRFRSRQD